MKILVTGGSGYIGSVTTEMLCDAGNQVTVFDNLERGHIEAVDPRAQLIRGDLRNPGDIDAAMQAVRPDAVFHFAAYALVGESMADPMMYFQNNVGGGINLVDAMLKVGVKRIIFSSTCATYGQPDHLPMTEDLPQHPTNPYGESKLMLETVMRWQQERSGLEPTFLRYFNACGATEKHGEDHDPETHIIPNVLRVALGQADAVPVFGDDYATPDGTCVRDYIHIVDLARAHILALDKHALGPFNLGTGTGFSVMQIVQACRDVTGHPIPVKMSPRRPGDPAALVAGADKAAQVLGWMPARSDVHTVVRDAWAWHQRHPHGYATP
ncbi:MAG: UDP-glucose 4-epimerase GalE [Kiritimatiellae bacterium]|nr:UDP-glucose 4-epimerase GalE [Kiritimatiellia bacterium]MBQ9345068.1 UDP-glucose 4-epimerase GalE [Kiritimatiellia bacterium]